MEKRKERLGLTLHDAQRAMRRAFERRAAGLGLSSAQWRLLVHLWREGQATQARLADLLEVEPISVSRLVDRMEAAGWVQRLPDPGDRRVRLVAPTDRMEAAREAILTMADDVYAVALKGFSPGEREALVAALARLIDNLTEDEAAAVPPAREEADERAE